MFNLLGFILSSENKGKKFENQVAELFRLLNYDITQNINFHGHQIDILLETILPGDFHFITAIECKYLEKGNLRKNDAISDINKLKDLLQNDKINYAKIVTNNGFSKDLHTVAKSNGISLSVYRELEGKIIDFIPFLKFVKVNYEKQDINKYYIEPYAKKRTRKEFLLSDYIIDFIKKIEINLISILGEFGVGKTSFCQKINYELAKKYLNDPFDNRVPILFNLRDYSDSVNISQLITDTLVNSYGWKNINYLLFNKMNENGLFLLIFDGFDEMSQKTIFDVSYSNFMKISDLAKPKRSKVILTCRKEFFKSYENEKEILLDIGKKDNSEIIYLREFDDSQIQTFLKKRLPLLKIDSDWHYYYANINELFDLYDIATRPVLLELIVNHLPTLIQTKERISISSLYNIAINSELNRRLIIGKTLIEKKDRMRLIELLALWMFSNNKYSIYYEDIPNLIKMRENFDLKTSKEIEFYLNDFLACSFLIRDNNGNYRFSHKSFVEYFVANYIHNLDEINRDLFISKYIENNLIQLFSLLPYSEDKFLETILQYDTIMDNCDYLSRIIWLKSWIDYHILNPKSKINLPKVNLKSESKGSLWVIKYEEEKLSILNLIDCDISKIPDNVINKIKDVRILYLTKNRLLNLPDSISKLSNLEELYLVSNRLKDLPDSICELKKLRILYLESNSIEKLPDNFGNLNNLEKLSLFNNNLKKLPDSFCKLINLKELDLSGNKIPISEIEKMKLNLSKLYT